VSSHHTYECFDCGALRRGCAWTSCWSTRCHWGHWRSNNNDDDDEVSNCKYSHTKHHVLVASSGELDGENDTLGESDGNDVVGSFVGKSVGDGVGNGT
jgi:hypothetical protein